MSRLHNSNKENPFQERGRFPYDKRIKKNSFLSRFPIYIYIYISFIYYLPVVFAFLALPVLSKSLFLRINPPWGVDGYPWILILSFSPGAPLGLKPLPSWNASLSSRLFDAMSLIRDQDFDWLRIGTLASHTVPLTKWWKTQHTEKKKKNNNNKNRQRLSFHVQADDPTKKGRKHQDLIDPLHTGRTFKQVIISYFISFLTVVTTVKKLMK